MKVKKQPLYQEVPENFYFCQLNSRNPLRAYWHRGRRNIIRAYVARFYQPKKRIIDLGCGNAVWNTDKLPVTGVDISSEVLQYNLEKGTISKKIKGDIGKFRFPSNSADIVIITEVLEHIKDYEKAISSIYKMLRRGGIVIASVPYVGFLSLWTPLFRLQCSIEGCLHKKKYYKQKCGHVNNFDRVSFKRAFTESGFSIMEDKLFINMTCFVVAKKPV